MEELAKYQKFVRDRITELRLQKGVSEHRMSLDLGKSGSYIRSITNGIALPSLRELFNTMIYFEISPSEFFINLEDSNSLRAKINSNLRQFSDEDLNRVFIFMSWLKDK